MSKKTKKVMKRRNPFQRRAVQRHLGKRQIPFPHEHAVMAGAAYRTGSSNDPDNDGDVDTPGSEGPGQI